MSPAAHLRPAAEPSTPLCRAGGHIPFDGACNFRDLGGHRLADGRVVRPGLLYRSDHLGKLSRGDLRRIDQLGLRLIIDLRGEQERRSRRDRLPRGHTAQLLHLPIYNHDVDYADIRRRLLSGRLHQPVVEAFFLGEYRRYVTAHDDTLRALFARLLDADSYPLLIHCTAGKDRTGVVAALILLALGVAREQVYADFLATSRYMEAFVRRLLPLVRLLSLFRARRSQVMGLALLQSAWLDEALTTIDARHGSLDRYLTHLGLDRSGRERLRELLCGC